MRVHIYGVDADLAVQGTRALSGCSLFHPVWHNTLEFTIHVPQLALVRFVVLSHSSDADEDLIAQYTLRATSMLQGFRAVPLCAPDGTPLPLSRLFVRVCFETAESTSTNDSAMHSSTQGALSPQSKAVEFTQSKAVEFRQSP